MAAVGSELWVLLFAVWNGEERVTGFGGGHTRDDALALFIRNSHAGCQEVPVTYRLLSKYS